MSWLEHYSSMADALNRADAEVVAKVVAVGPGRQVRVGTSDDFLPFTNVVLSVVSSGKGGLRPNSTFTLEQTGGQSKRGPIIARDDPPYAVGETYFLLLRKRADSGYRIISPVGRFKVAAGIQAPIASGLISEEWRGRTVSDVESLAKAHSADLMRALWLAITLSFVTASGCGAPLPKMTANTGGQELAVRMASYCWSTPGTGVCADPPPLNEVIKSMKPGSNMAPGAKVQLHFDRSPDVVMLSEIDLGTGNQTRVSLGSDRTFVAPDQVGLHGYVVSAQWPDGTVEWVLALKVSGPQAKGTHPL